MKFPLADSHIHFFAQGYPGRYGALFPRGGEVVMYERIRRIHSIERALVVGYEGGPWAVGNNRYVAKLVKSHPWMTPLAFAPSKDEPTATRLNAWWRQGFAGLSIYVTTAAEARRVAKWSSSVVDALNAKRAIISVNVPSRLVGTLRPFFERLNETRILISHLGLPGAMATASRELEPVLALADLPHLGVKYSAAYACNAYPHPGLSEILQALHDRFGPSRLYWGSDFSPALDDVTFSQTIDSIGTFVARDTSTIFSKNLLAAIRRVRSGSPCGLRITG